MHTRNTMTHNVIVCMIAQLFEKKVCGKGHWVCSKKVKYFYKSSLQWQPKPTSRMHVSGCLTAKLTGRASMPPLRTRSNWQLILANCSITCDLTSNPMQLSPVWVNHIRLSPQIPPKIQALMGCKFRYNPCNYKRSKCRYNQRNYKRSKCLLHNHTQ